MRFEGRPLGPAPVVVVTGATDGIGRETARRLVGMGARVVVHGRSVERVAKTRAALEAVRDASTLEPVVRDLASLAACREIVRDLERAGTSVDVVVHNAGVYQNRRETSADGFELTFAVNHLAPFALTHELLASPAGAALARIVVVSSIAHGRGRIDLDDLSFERRGFDPYATYAASKLANVLFAVELAARLATRGIAANALHPGVVSTKLLTEGFGMRGSDSLVEGASTSVMLALSPDVVDTTGRYFSASREVAASAAARDPKLARALYETSCELVGTAALPG